MFFPHLNVRCLVFSQEWYHQIEALCDSSMDAKTNKTFKKKRLWGIHHYRPIFADFCHLLFVPSSVPHNVRKESPMTCQSLGNPTKVVFFQTPKKWCFFDMDTGKTDCHVPTSFFSCFGVPQLKQDVVSMFWDLTINYTSNTYITWLAGTVNSKDL